MSASLANSAFHPSGVGKWMETIKPQTRAAYGYMLMSMSAGLACGCMPALSLMYSGTVAAVYGLWRCISLCLLHGSHGYVHTYNHTYIKRIYMAPIKATAVSKHLGLKLH